MVYYVPRPYKCPKCNSEFEWSIDFKGININRPVCPDCYVKFILDNVPIGISKDKE